MASATISALALVALLAGAADACILKPGGCLERVCSALPTVYPNPSKNYSLPATWDQPAMKGVAFYNGVWNKRASTTAAPTTSTFATWKASKSSPYYVNLEKVPVEQAKVLTTLTPSSLKDCCTGCAAYSGCALYLYHPSSRTTNAPLTGGTCYYLSGGTFLQDGPFDLATQQNLGSPNSGTRQQQATSTTPTGYLGGACNPAASVTDDPHFTGAHGTRFDFNGQLNKAYCLVTDRDIHINAVLKGYETSNTLGASVGATGKATRSWIKEVGIVWADASGTTHSLKLTARPGKEQARGLGFLASAVVDGEPIAIPAAAGSGLKSGDLAFYFLGVAKKGRYEVDKYNLKVGNKLDLSFDMRVAHPKLQTVNDAEVHFNLMFNNLLTSNKVHGVLGQTYRNTPQQLAKAVKFSELVRLLGSPVQADGATGKGLLEGGVDDYVASSVLAPDCKVSAFV